MMRWLLLFLTLTALPASAGVQVLRVIDGDTLEVNASVWVSWDGQARVIKNPVKVRLVSRVGGIDTPELTGSSPCEKVLAYQAKAFVEGWVSAGETSMVPEGLDTFSRPLVRLERGSEDLGSLLIQVGLAKPYVKGVAPVWC